MKTQKGVPMSAGIGGMEICGKGDGDEVLVPGTVQRLCLMLRKVS